MKQPSSHVDSLWDIVGKTIDNVTYAPSTFHENEIVILHFTDGTALTIKVSEWFESITMGLDTPTVGWGDKREKS